LGGNISKGISDKVLLFKIYNKLLKLNNKEGMVMYLEAGTWGSRA
jgi:hypothetical protein